MEASRDLLEGSVFSQEPDFSLAPSIAQEAEGLMNGFYDQDYFHTGEIRSPGGELVARRYAENAVAIRLQRLGGSVTIICLFEDDEFSKGRRITKAGEEITNRHDFKLTDIDPIILQELRDARAIHPKP